MFLLYLTEIFLLSYSEKGNTVPGYDFLVNSVWPEIVRGLEEKLPSLFNPGDPDEFLFLGHNLIIRLS